jgi:hypothetical protein
VQKSWSLGTLVLQLFRHGQFEPAVGEPSTLME